MTRALNTFFAPFLFVMAFFGRTIRSGGLAVRAISLGILLAMIQLAFGVLPAQAADTPVTISDLSASNVSLLLGLLVPFFVALFTKYNTNATVRVWMNLALSAFSGALATLVASDGGFAWTTFILSSVASFLSSALSYLAVYKPSGVAALVAVKTANFGVGTPKQVDGAVSYLSDTPDTVGEDEVALAPSDIVDEAPVEGGGA